MTDETSPDLLAVCEREQLHLSNAVQNFGLLLAVDTDLTVTHVSTNVAQWLDREPADLLDSPITEALGPNFDPRGGAPTALKRRRLQRWRKSPEADSFQLLVTDVDQGFLIEIQSAPPEVGFQGARLSQILRLPAAREGLPELMAQVVSLVRELSGFEKAMIYQFHEDWSGEVVAETGGDQFFDRYMGLRFPASDIPKIARDLYLNTPYRLIPDVAAPPASVVGSNDHAPPLDLTYADLRSVSPVHLAYLKNMNVGASLSIPVIINDQLWALVALHHPEKRYVSIDARHQCLDAVNAFTLTLRSLLVTERMAHLENMDSKIAEIVKGMDLHADVQEGLRSVETALLGLVGAESGALVIEDAIYPIGPAPNRDIINVIDTWALNSPAELPISTDCLSEHLPRTLDHADQVSGVLAVQSPSGRGARMLRLYWFRPELPQVIQWAGNPDKPVTDPSGALPISPRQSFEKWTETTQARSKPWTHAEETVAIKFRAMVLRSMVRQVSINDS
ncbi:GAF domain-containing protein [Magnetospira sp. QH-2]|uniref:GAF domain-containing protein n=1 Tax=Magnetospira sp. (strain QH-2) TaxID=1288970 RepID=UPI0003E80C5E|nr:GAF domain-containing protein [Magnetospira sp. QH-2]CCQ73234.1 Bacteriophytochrome [Magnetospira sp. QH-2]